jgi:glutaminyl-tRNA synthetase
MNYMHQIILRSLYEFAVKLIKKGLAYVDDSTAEEIAAQKGTPTEPGKGNEYRNRSVEENLDLFEECAKVNLKMEKKCCVQRLI